MSDEMTLNEGGDTTSAAGSSPATGNFDDFIPTMPEEEPVPTSAETQNTVQETAQPEQPEEVKAEPEKVDDPAVDDSKEPFHKHPRFQQLITRNREYEQQLQEMRQQMDMLAKQAPAHNNVPDLESQFSTLAQKLEDGDISMAEALSEQRKLIEQSAQQQIQSVMQTQQRDAEAGRIQDTFLSENPDFTELRDSGELQTLVASNPLHDNLSAYYAHKAQQAEQAKETAVKAAVAEAVKETEARLRKEYTSKRNAASLGESAAHVPSTSNVPPELKDTKRFGGTVNVLANRLKAFREGARA